eukprot:SAG11_NODE_27750_length_329_cov_1.139130_1_plen_45_part_01
MKYPAYSTPWEGVIYKSGIIEVPDSSSNLGGSNSPTPNYPKNHVK